MMVSIGFVPEPVGKALASPIQAPAVSWSSPSGLATEVRRVAAQRAAAHLVRREEHEVTPWASLLPVRRPSMS
jgi:hypothetical protein